MERKVDADRDSRIGVAANSNGAVPEEPNRPVQAWQFVDGFQRLMGDDAEPDPLFFVESWTLGTPAAVERFMQRRQEQPVRKRQDEMSRDFEDYEISSLIQERAELNASAHAIVGGDWEVTSSEQYSEEKVARTYPPVAEDGEKVAGGCRGGHKTDPITELDACEILGVTVVSSRRQIRAAYHRKVSQWHPDRLGRASEEMRLFATEQMAAINEAYHLLTSD